MAAEGPNQGVSDRKTENKTEVAEPSPPIGQQDPSNADQTPAKAVPDRRQRGLEFRGAPDRRKERR